MAHSPAAAGPIAMSETGAGLVLFGVPVLGLLAGVAAAWVTRHSRALWGIAGFFIAGVCVVAVMALIPQFASAARSGIVAMMEDPPGPGTLWSYWRNLFPLDAWRSIGAIILPVIVIVIPVIFWQIRKIHINE